MRQDTLLILSLALTVKLFPPLRYIVKAGLVVGYDLYLFSFAEKNVADCRIKQGRILLIRSVKRFLSSGSSSLHQLVNVSAADCDG